MLRNRTVFWLLFLLLLVLLVISGVLSLSRFSADLPPEQVRELLPGTIILLLSALALILLGVWFYLDRYLLLPLRALARGVRIIVHSNPAHDLELPKGHLLTDLPEHIHELGQALQQSKREAAEAMATGAEQSEQQKNQLAQVLLELSEGVVVCDANARVLLYNPALVNMLPEPAVLGLGRSLYNIFNPAPIKTTLKRLQPQQEIEAEFACPLLKSNTTNPRWLHCRLRLLPATEALSAQFVISCTDMTQRLEAHNTQEMVGASLEQLRQPLASLQAAAENVTTATTLTEQQRETFLGIIAKESDRLGTQLDQLWQQLRQIMIQQWPLYDVLSSALLDSVVQQLQPAPKIQGDPLWLHIDSHSITALLEFLLGQLTTKNDLAIETLLGNRRIYLDISWQGAPIAMSEIQSWLQQPLMETVTVGDVLRRHNSELWSQRLLGQSRSVLRLPLPVSQRQWQAKRQVLPARPEFYDFSLKPSDADWGNLTDCPLERLNYVVFDTETTGLEPSKGDEMVQIAGVRIVNKRILTGECFDRLINPGRFIPRASIKFHGITDKDVQDQPDASVVVAAFHTFVGGDDTVLVAHNAAFDMKFLRMKEKASRVHFANPVLDTLLLSAFLHDHAQNHNLDAIAERLGVVLQNRHNALGDTLGTAEVFIRLLDLLQAQNIKTLGQALEASEKMITLRRMQAKF